MSDTTTQVLEKFEIYIPKGAVNLKNALPAQIRLGLQGYGGEGKSYAAATFPNATYVSFDRGLGALAGREDIHEVKFYDDDFVDSICKRKQGEPANRRDAYLKWLNTEARKMSPIQTLVNDAVSDIETAFDTQEALEPVRNSEGVVDARIFWRHKMEYFQEIMTILKSLKCHVINLCHEQDDRDSKGNLNGKIKPMMNGQFKDKIVKEHTDWFRQMAINKYTEEKISDKVLKDWGFKTKQEMLDMQKQFPRDTIYCWKLDGDDIFSGKCSSLVNFPSYIPANYSSFQKYQRKTI